ncbi:MAG: NIPSNAP family containing protein [Saprospiraceae bacterium]|nr:NIPSNAP family containing protein [Saprospiraceae bacterium]
MQGVKVVIIFYIIMQSISSFSQNPEFYEIRCYQLSNNDQVKAMDSYLKTALLPAIHSMGINRVGVFKEVGIDTASEKRMFVLVPSSSVSGLPSMAYDAYVDQENRKKGDAFWMAPHDSPPYDRLDITIIKSFEYMSRMHVPSFETDDMEQIFELRSYEGATERLYRQKVKMFNQGGEMDIFADLDFNSVFYGEVLVGSQMPNLMYMTSFKDMSDRDQHWDAFREAPAWADLKVQEEYANTVSKIHIYLLHPTGYSDL